MCMIDAIAIRTLLHGTISNEYFCCRYINSYIVRSRSFSLPIDVYCEYVAGFFDKILWLLIETTCYCNREACINWSCAVQDNGERTKEKQ